MIDPGCGDPFLGVVQIGEGGDATIGLTGVFDEVQNGFHRSGPFADNDGAVDRFLGIRRRGHEPRDDVFAHPRLRHIMEIPNAIEKRIKGGVGQKLRAGVDKFLIRDHALASGNSEASLRVDVKADGHGKGKLKAKGQSPRAKSADVHVLGAHAQLFRAALSVRASY